jgi:hypothetical protein
MGGDTEGVVAELPPEARHAVDRVRELARARPLTTAGIATGIGYVLGNGVPRPRLLIGAALGYGIFRILRRRRAAAAAATDDAANGEDEATGDEGEDEEEEDEGVANEATAEGAEGQPAPRKKHRRHKPKRATASSER